MIERKKVALRFSLNSGFARQIVRGIIAYTQKHGPWEIDIRSEEPIAFSTWAELKKWKGDGIIAPAYQKEHLRMLAGKGIPVVTTSCPSEEIPFPAVTFDDAAIGKMAAEHLLEHNLDRFAFIGPKEWGYSIARCNGFIETLSDHGANCTKCWIRPATNARQLNETWIESSYYLDALKQLVPPVGVFASNDRVGYGILQACRHLGLRVPEDVCLLSVDNDEILCNLANPHLSSIALSGEEFGYQAAAMLDTLMRGQPLENNHVVIPPRGVVLRNSSDFLTVEDRYVADALRYIRNHSGHFIDVSDVMSIMPISRRSLERRFQDIVGHGVYKEISRCHIERAKELLEQTDRPVSHVARESGFNSTNRFEDTFRKETGLSATDYRKKIAARARRKKK
ncbi:MAG: DNA-binding transcriptional regulator [Verrucomicrobia bacterium]|nr:DNA-binding transcriptional regulator [Verrucomicrobiota bacterium]